jgi:hypothetical protein
MTSVTCFVADFNLVPGFPVLTDLSLKGRSLASYFLEASGGDAIDLRLDFSRRGALPGLVDSNGVNPDQLMDGAARLLGMAVPGSAPVIALLIADTCAPAPGQFGLMFDIDGYENTLGPRQGCAVFLTGIAAKLQNNDMSDPTAKEFIGYIAAHELGHAFNLWHVDDGSIMQPHPDPGTMGAVGFDLKQSEYLKLARDPATAGYVLPGVGRSPFGARASGYPSGGDQPFASPATQAEGLKLQIGLSNTSFWQFEPVDLEVTLSISDGAAINRTVADEIDPGYESFQIWIAPPNGMSFCYRSGARYCHGNGWREIGRGKSYARDISITRQSMGYTFAALGVYRVQVFFATGKGIVLASNVVECEVRHADPESPIWQIASATLDNAEVQSMLRFKRRLPSVAAYAQLMKYLSGPAGDSTAAAIHYSLGKAMVLCGGTADAVHKRRLRSLGASHLHKAVDSKCLGQHREGVARRLVRRFRRAPANQ